VGWRVGSHHCSHVLDATEALAEDEHLGEGGVQGELHHLPVLRKGCGGGEGGVSQGGKPIFCGCVWGGRGGGLKGPSPGVRRGARCRIGLWCASDLPSGVSSPVLSSAPKNHKWYMELSRLS
jgi:hypothetical protein